MSLATQIDSLATQIGTQIKDNRTKMGGSATVDLSTLTSTVKTSLIAAINSNKLEIGTLSSLSTTAQANLVAAINEIAATAGAAVVSVNGETGTVVLDTADVAEGTNLYYTEARADARVQAAKGDTATPSTSEWTSSQDTVDYVTAAINAVIDSAPGALDTLNELATAITSNDTDITGLLTAIGNRVRFDSAQVLTGPQQTQAQDNMQVYSRTELGDPATDFVATFNASLV